MSQTGTSHPIAVLRRSLQKPGVWHVQYRTNRQMRRQDAARQRAVMTQRHQTWNRIAARVG